MSNNPYRCEALDGILATLHPYEPEKFILGEYYMGFTTYGLVIENTIGDDGTPTARMTLKAFYRGIPIERSDRKYELDFKI